MTEIVTICLQTAHYENDWLCGVCHTMRIHGIALKMGVLFERSEFRPFSNDMYSQRNGSSGRPPFSSSIQGYVPTPPYFNTTDPGSSILSNSWRRASSVVTQYFCSVKIVFLLPIK